jgi:hypothetical protein
MEHANSGGTIDNQLLAAHARGRRRPNRHHSKVKPFPSHNPEVAFPGINSDELDYLQVTSDCGMLVPAWLKENRLLRSLWRTRTSQYLPSLGERSTTRLKGKQQGPPLVKERVVVIFMSDTSRASCRLARVIKAIKGYDNQARSA